jgi:hypothetical protein
MYILEKNEYTKSDLSDEDFPFWLSAIWIFKTGDNHVGRDDKWIGIGLSICLGLRICPYPTCFTVNIAWDYTAILGRDKTLNWSDPEKS